MTTPLDILLLDDLERLRDRADTRGVGDDPPEIRDWTWPGANAHRPEPG